MSGANPGIMYGLPKIHKPNLPIRPILSAIGTFNYKLAKFLVPILRPLTFNQYTINNTSHFIDDIKRLRFDHNTFMASFDVTSLFTNIPLDETVNICTDKLYSKGENPLEIPKDSFQSMINIAVKDNYFIFNSDLYQQINGCSMGGPLSPSLANAFMCHHEEIWMKQCPEAFRPLFFRRFVDDIFCIFRDKSQAQLFKDFLNSRHKNITFTAEFENNNKLDFLDVSLTFANGLFTYKTYRKPTFTGLGTSFESFIPLIFKLNSISTLINRAFITCSDWFSLHEELEFLTKYFLQNKYPIQIIQKIINKFLNNKIIQVPVRSTVPKLLHYVSLPYYGQYSYDLRNELGKLLLNTYPYIEFRFVFKNTRTIGSLFRYKDRIPEMLQTSVVYLWKCTHADCNASYIGSTTRCLHDRIAQHRGVSERTYKELAKKDQSSIRSHCNKENHELNLESFSIIGRESDPTTLRLMESILIKLEEPSLNVMLHTEKIFTI